MSEKPILFSAQNVRAILAGDKTQARQIIKPQPAYPEAFSDMEPHMIGGECHWFIKGADSACTIWRCPHGGPGTRLWVKEAFRDHMPFGCDQLAELIEYKATPWPESITGIEIPKWKPPIHLPRAFSRITLEITGIRVERLQDIGEADAKAEGCKPWEFGDEQTMTTGERGAASPYRGGFACLWDDLHPNENYWKVNPYVCVIEFERVAV